MALFNVRKLEDGNCALTAYTDKEQTKVEIPEIVNKMTVCCLSTQAFKRAKQVKEVSIPKTVHTIEPGVFDGCEELETLTVDADNRVFYSENNCVIRFDDKALVCGCKGSVIPEGVKHLFSQSFAGTGIETVTIPSSVETMDTRASKGLTFGNCAALTKVVVQEGLTELQDLDFLNCKKLTEIELPATLTRLPSFNPFAGCGKVAVLTVAEGNPAYYADGCTLVRKSDRTVVAGFAESRVPEGVTTVGRRAFTGIAVKLLHLPSTLQKIEPEAFDRSKVKKVVFHGTAEQWATVQMEYREAEVLKQAAVEFAG